MVRLSARLGRCFVAVALGASTAGLLTAAATAAANTACPSAASSTAVACTYAYTGGEQTYTVPAGVTRVRITAVGAPGGSTGTGTGGSGAAVAATVSLPAGTTTLYVEVGGSSGFNGGAPGGQQAGSGGGASDVRTCSRNSCTAFYPSGLADCQATAAADGVPASACSPDPRLVVAGGGGGGGTAVVGGSAGDSSVTGPGDGGATQGNVPAVPGGNGGFGGTAGGTLVGAPFDGWGGSICHPPQLQAQNGALIPQWGLRCPAVTALVGTAGGGGGYYGGGGGFGVAPGWPKDGGGAGSSYWVPGASDTTMATDSSRTAAVTITALDLPQTISFASTPPSAPVVGGSYAVSATATSGLPVSFSVGTTSTPGACTVSGASVSFTGAGVCVIDADQPGDANWAPAPQVAQTITVGPATPAISWAQPADIPYGTELSNAQLDATSSVPGTFAYTPDAGTLLDVGTHTLNAEFTPDDSTDYTPASAAVPITVSRAATSTAVHASPAAPLYGDGVTVTADVTHGPAAPGTLEPTGSVSFTVDGQPDGPPVPLAGGTAQAPAVSGLPPGDHTIGATYSGDGHYLGSTVSAKITVDRAAQTVSFTSTPPSGAAYGDTYAASAQASSGLPVQLSIDARSTPGACTLNAGTVTFTGVGSCLLDADQPGDADYAPAPQAQQLIGIGRATPKLAWPAPNAITYGTALSATQLDATASVPGTFTYSRAAGTLLPAGSYVVVADFTPADSADFNAASISATITVDPAPTTIVAATSPAAPQAGQPVTVTATLSHPPLPAGAAPPTGTVLLAVDGKQVGAALTIAGDQVVSPPLPGLSAGVHVVTVAYSGDANFAPATDRISVTVAAAPPSGSTSATGGSSAASTSGGTTTVSSSASRSTPGGTSSGAGGGLALTGQAERSLVCAGVLLVALGLVLIGSARRRRPRRH